MITIVNADCRDGLVRLREEIGRGERRAFQTCVTSPPYFGLRNYGVGGQLGLEDTPEQYVSNLVEVFRLVRDVLRFAYTLWS